MAERYRATEAEIRALNAYVNLMRASDAVASRLASALREQKLTLSQLDVLEALYHSGAMTQTALAKRIVKSGGNVTMIVDNLEKRDLVSRKRTPDDRRSFQVELTEKGLETMRTLFPNHVKKIVAQMDPLSKVEQEELRSLCRKITDNASNG